MLSGQLPTLNRQSCGGKNPVHLAVDPGNRFIVTANYWAGSVGVVPIGQDGTLGARTDLATFPGEPGPNREGQANVSLLLPVRCLSWCPIRGLTGGSPFASPALAGS